MILLNFKKINLILQILIFSLFFNIICVSAKTNSYVKIGLYYSSSAKSEYTVSASGLYAATETLDELIPLDSSNVRISSDDNFHIRYSSGLDEYSIIQEIENLNSKGANAYPVYKSGSFEVWGDSFETENDALWAVQNLGLGGEVVSPSGKRIVFWDTANNKILYISENSAVIASTSGKTKLTAVAEKEYRGGMLFVPADGGTLNAINIVDTEEYLYSVISREMSPSWPIEALKAQAVCARNYVAQNKNKHSKYGFDLCDSVCCQAYAGTSSEADGSYAPVDETRGKLLVYGDEIAQVFYCSSIGPTTEDVKYVWGSDFPYLTSVENPYEDYENVYNGKWEKTLTKKRATEIMNQKGYNIGDVVEIKATEYSPNGRVIKLLVKGTNGEKTFTRESCRIVFSEVTLSQMYTISGGGAASYPEFSVLGADKSGDDVLSLKTAKNLAVISSGSDGVEKKLKISDSLYVQGENNKYFYGPVSQGSSDVYTFSGIGWGHGIGMSQYGAKGMAEAGFDYEEILTHYFKGCEIK